MDVNGWNEWSKYVLKELERLNDCYDKLDKRLDKLTENVTITRIRMAGIGATVSLIITTLGLLVYHMLK